MILEILSTEKNEQFSGIEYLEIETIAGKFVIQSGYAPTVFILQPNSPIVFGVVANPQKKIITRGILEVNREKATLFVSI